MQTLDNPAYKVKQSQICLRGELEVRELNPDRVTRLGPLERYTVPKAKQGPGRVEFRALPKAESRFSG